MPKREGALVIPELFDRASSGNPKGIALQIKREGLWQALTYEEVKAGAIRVAGFLLAEGLKKGDFVALLLENSPEWAVIYLGISYAGLACVPLDIQLSCKALKNLLSDSSAKVIFSSRQILSEELRGIADELHLECVAVDASFLKSKSAGQGKLDLPQVLPQDIASLVYTSGTTSNPKGVILTHRNFCSNFAAITQLDVCSSSDNLISLLPLHHTYAFMGTLLVPLLLGAKVTYCPSLKSKDMIETIKEGRVSVLMGVPQLFSLLYKSIADKISKIPFFFRPFALPFVKSSLRKRLGNDLRLLVSGGARIDPAVVRGLSRLGFRMIEGYGLTETSPIATLNSHQKVKPGSVGRPLPGVKIKILNPNDSGVGQVLIKGPNVMQGYFKRPDLTREAIRDGWFYSGDSGYLDKEGYLFLVGREKEVIVLASGKNIYPQELEEHYLQSPYIKEICVLSKDEKLAAVVVPDLEYLRKTKETGIGIGEKIRWELENLGKELASYNHIMGFKVVKEDLPRTALNKIKRYQVRELYFSQSLPDPEVTKEPPAERNLPGVDQALADNLIGFISKELKKPVNPDSHLEIDLGIDSLGKVELFLGLERKLGITIPDGSLSEASTVREVLLIVSGIIKAGAAVPYAGREKDWGKIIRQALPDELLERKIRLRIGFADKLFNGLFKVFFMIIFKIFWFLRIKMKNPLPADGPYIICANHASYLDPFVLFCGIPLGVAQKTFFLVYSQIFEHPSVSWSAKIARLISIDSSSQLCEAMQAAALVLRNNKIICIFPEGRRAVDEKVAEFKKGIGILVKELDVPVIPAYIKGSHCSWPRTERLPRPYPLRVTFGSPMSARDLIKAGSKRGVLDDYQAIANAIREEVLKLSC
ncbi:AMP-binding protein [Candidatus Omnitrophota bacterium]